MKGKKMVRSTLPAVAGILLCFVLMTMVRAETPSDVLPVPGADQIWDAIDALEARVAELERKPVTQLAAPVAVKSIGATVASVACPSGQCPMPQTSMAASSRSRTVSRSVQSYSPRWHNNDGMSLRDHAIREHGLDPSLSDAQLFAAHDAYHDQYGGNPPAMRSRSVAVQSPMASSCPGGRCPTARTATVQSSGGLLGFGFFGRRR